MGAVTTFDIDIAEEILERLRAGDSLRKACLTVQAAHTSPPSPEGTTVLDARCPSPQTVLRWANDRDGVPAHAGFAEQYAQARATGWHLIGEEIVDIADDRTIPPEDKRLMVDARKWLAGKMLPRVFGEKLQLQHEGEIGLRVIRREIVQAPKVER